MGLILVRYGELALKSRPVRLRFERALLRNIEEMFLREGLECLTSREWGRVLLRTGETARALGLLARVFGVTSFSPASECPSDAESVSALAVELASRELRAGRSFAVRARRSGSHPYTSQQLAARVGRAVLDACAGMEVRVDLEAPDVELFIEVRGERAYLFFERLPGPGGLPLGTQGRVAALLEDERSAAAAWLMMKRGCRVVAAGRAERAGGAPSPPSPPDPEAITEGARTALAMLAPWAPGIKLHPLGDTSLGALVRFAARRRAEALVLGSTWGELEEGVPVAGIPILFPLCGMSGDEIQSLVKKIRGVEK